MTPQPARTLTPGRRIGVFALAMLVALVWMASMRPAPALGDAAEFDALSQRAQSEPQAMSVEDVKRLLTLGRELGRPLSTHLVARRYFSTTMTPDAELLRLAAENAMLAGDPRSAVARYKAYLQQAAPDDPAAAKAAGQAYAILVDVLRAADEAYALMTEHGGVMRGDISAVKFDPWYLDQARRRDDVPAAAERLAVIFAQAMPIEQERLLYWDHLDWLIRRVSLAREQDAPALPSLARLAEVIRQDSRRTLELKTYTAMLAWSTGSRGQSAEERREAYGAVLEAAQAYLDHHPTPATVANIIAMFAGGHGAWTAEVNQHLDAKRSFLSEAFGKLDDAGRIAVLEHQHQGRNVHALIADGRGWAELAAAHPQAFAGADVLTEMPFAHDAADAEVYKLQEAFLKDVPSRHAAISNALAANGTFLEALTHLVTAESWHLDGSGYHDLIANHLWRHYVRMADGDDRPTDAATYSQAIASVGREHLSQSPIILFDTSLASAYVTHAWRVATAKDETRLTIVDDLQAMAWVPYGEASRTRVFGPAYDEFKRWTSQIRRQDQQKRGSVPDEILKQISTIEAAFSAVIANDEGDVDAAPTPLTAALARAELAFRQGRGGAFVQHAGEAWDLVKDFAADRTPFGHMTMRYVLQTEPATASTIELQVRALRHAVAKVEPGMRAPWEVRQVAQMILTSRQGWGPGRIPAADQAKAEALFSVFDEALHAMVRDGGFSDVLWQWCWDTRSGSGWSNWSLGEDTFAAMIEKQSLQQSAWRHPYPSAAACYQWLVRNRYPGLTARYRPEAYFDDMLIAEGRESGVFDWNYWVYGRDESRKVITAVAQMFAGFDRLPLGYGDEPGHAGWDREVLWNWHHRLLGAPEAARDAALATATRAYGKTRFDDFAMGLGDFVNSPPMGTAEGRATWFARLAAFSKKADAAPRRVAPPALPELARVPMETLTDDELAVLIGLVAGSPPARFARHGHYENLGELIARGLTERGRADELYPLIPTLWRIARDTGSAGYQRTLIEISQELANRERHGVASVMTATGLEMLGAELLEEVRTALTTLRANSLVHVGAVIPVSRSDPRYPIFASQADFLRGRMESAWEQYLPARSRILNTFRDLDPSYLIWLIERHTEAESFAEAESIARAVIQWMDDQPAGFELEARAGVLVAYAGIALKQQEYPRARAQFERIVAAREFEGTFAQRRADLKIAEVDRITRQYDKAIDRLDRLTRRADRVIQGLAWFEKARMAFDQEEFVEASSFLEEVFVRLPSHSPSRILKAEIDLRMKRLIEATQVKVGIGGDQRVIVPGRPLRVELEDRNLAVVGSAQSIEVRVWTTSGDNERFMLFPRGDSRTRFEGEIPTELNAVRSGDRVLQLRGDDQVFYNFARGASDEDDTPSGVLDVATGAELYASSGRILGREEQEEAALEELIRQQLRMRASYEERLALNARRPSDQVKPGNAINVRVVDPDRSVSDEPDAVRVAVRTSSGDEIESFTLTETGPYTGVFEGAVPTASGQATAYASDSNDGNEPNFAISSQDAYPPWVGMPDGQRPKHFSVDLNDNVALNTMTVTADVPGRKLRDFLVQISLNGVNFHDVGSWPGNLTPWDGSLAAEVVSLPSGGQITPTLQNLTDYLERGRMAQGHERFPLAITGPALALDRNLQGQAGPMRIGWNDWYLVRAYGMFHVDQAMSRTISLDTHGQTDQASYLLAIDGQVSSSPTRITRFLSAGVHRIDVFVVAHRQADPRFTLMMDSPEPPYMTPMPTELFDPGEHPAIRAAAWVEPARVDVDDQGDVFTVRFAEDTRARVVRLLIRDFETDAPAIRRIRLLDIDNNVVLPTEQDFTQLRQNQTLEIVPGDRITITYDDPKPLVEARARQNAFLNATYSDGELSAAFVEYEIDGRGDRQAQYVSLRRFEVGDPIKVFINDPDGDTSENLDVLTFTARVGDRPAIELKALETDRHSGVFMGDILPVAGDPTRPTELRVEPGEDITLSYYDQENTDPGIPWFRRTIVEQVIHLRPELRVFATVTEPIEATHEESMDGDTVSQRVTEHVPVERNLLLARPKAPAAAGDQAASLVQGPLLVELLYPTIAKSPASRAVLYAQTSSGRAMNTSAAVDGFDIHVPGTIRLAASPGDPEAPEAPPGYATPVVRGGMFAGDALDDGRFSFYVPLEQGATPAETLAFEAEDERSSPRLLVNGKDTVYLGMRYEDEQGVERWIELSTPLRSDPFFHVMERRYQEPLETVHVGDSAYFRLIHPSLNESDANDRATITLETASGRRRTHELIETFAHSGVFKGIVSLVYEGEDPDPDDQTVLAVKYGDVVTATFESADGGAIVRRFAVHRGADGLVTPFTKRFNDPTIAVHTQFTIAEAYFEQAKKHRELGNEALAQRQIAQGKRLLEEAIRDYPNTDAQSQADYLLAELSFEFAKDATDAQGARDHYLEAINRFSDIVAKYPDSVYAPKAQYKKALVLEEMGEIDRACEEYVKLSYRYPDNELVAETIARLGRYFLTKGREFETTVAEETDPIEREKVRLRAKEMFTTAAEVFGRLSERFPDHSLAIRTLVLSGQCYMRAEQFEKATEMFARVYEDSAADNELAAESMYWAADSFFKLNNMVESYRAFKRLTWDYPESRWARFARGRLTDDALIQVAEEDARN